MTVAYVDFGVGRRGSGQTTRQIKCALMYAQAGTRACYLTHSRAFAKNCFSMARAIIERDSVYAARFEYVNPQTLTIGYLGGGSVAFCAGGAPAGFGGDVIYDHYLHDRVRNEDTPDGDAA